LNQNRLLQLAEEIEDELQRYLTLKPQIADVYVRVTDTEPDWFELRAIGSILHDVYNGAETICERIAKQVDGRTPSGSRWHRDLIEQMARPLEGVRIAVIRPETAFDVTKYLGFRHVFRSIYGSQLRWAEIKPLLDAAPSVVDNFAVDIQQFTAFLHAFGNSDE
jgi:hypothetical protein